jgi:hypothetical protein
MANQILAQTFFRSVVILCACPAVEKFCRASSAGGRLNLQTNFISQILSVAEDCLSPAGSFHGCSLMHGLKCGSYRFRQQTDLPPGSNMLRAEIQRALRRAPRQLRRLARLANSPGFKSFRCPRWRIKFSLERFSDQSCFCVRVQPLKNSAGRVPQAADGTCNKTS